MKTKRPDDEESLRVAKRILDELREFGVEAELVDMSDANAVRAVAQTKLH